MNAKHATLLTFSALLLASCAGNPHVQDSTDPKTVKERRRDKDGKLFGDLTVWSTERKRDGTGGAGGGSGIGVNAHLWYAALDTISFMPLASADPFGGVIITDWYSPEQSETERMKLNIFILDKFLRSDAVKVTVFHEKWDNKTRQWRATPTDSKMATEMENLILTRARQLRLNSAS